MADRHDLADRECTCSVGLDLINPAPRARRRPGPHHWPPCKMWQSQVGDIQGDIQHDDLELEQISFQVLMARIDRVIEKVDQLLARRPLVVCEDCQGEGNVSDSFGERSCSRCGGKGMVPA